MHPIRSRPICRAHNTFSPSLALWQHFVAPNQHLPQRPLQSPFATEAARRRDDDNVDSNQEDPAAAFDPTLLRKVEHDTLLRKVTSTSPGIVPKPRLYPDFRDKGGSDLQNNGQGTKQKTKAYRGEKGQDTEKILIQAYDAYDSLQDYKGVVVQPIFSIPVKENKYPWIVKNRESIKTGEERLNLEIQNFHEHIRPNAAESVARKHVIEQVRQHVREFLPGYVLEVFGSERTGIAFAKSDIDLRLVPENIYSDTTQAMLPPDPEERFRRRGDLRRLHQHLLRNRKLSYLLPTMRWARYPLISLQDRASGLDIQIVLANDTSLSRQFMQRYLEEYPYLAQLYSVIKATFDVRGLSDVFRGGIGSYSLFMMIVASLKHHPHPRDDAAGALIYFLRFWGGFKAEMHGLSIEPPELLAKSDPIMHAKALDHVQEGKTAPLPPWMPTLRDPADETNDLGRKIVAWKHVQKTLLSLHRNTRAELAQNTRVSLLARYIGPVYALQKPQRRRLAEYGRSLSEAGRQYTPTVVSQQAAEKDAGEDAVADEQAFPNLDELAAIARSIRQGENQNRQSAETAEKVEEAEQSAQDTETLNEAEEAAQRDEAGEVNPWLKNIPETSEHTQTREAFSSLLGLDKKVVK